MFGPKKASVQLPKFADFRPTYGGLFHDHTFTIFFESKTPFRSSKDISERVRKALRKEALRLATQVKYRPEKTHRIPLEYLHFEVTPELLYIPGSRSVGVCISFSQSKHL